MSNSSTATSMKNVDMMRPMCMFHHSKYAKDLQKANAFLNIMLNPHLLCFIQGAECICKKVPMSKGAPLLDMPFFERPGVLWGHLQGHSQFNYEC